MKTLKFKGPVSKETVERLKKKGIQVKTDDGGHEKKVKPSAMVNTKVKAESGNEGTVRVISFDRIVLSSKWTRKLALKQGDSLKIKLEDGKLILSK